jgi:uncharacterized repeat protein (TIGR03847 family)
MFVYRHDRHSTFLIRGYMPEFQYDFDPVDRITMGAIGQPGQRTFYLQARRGIETISLVVEKEQVSALAEAVEQLLENLTERNPLLTTSEDLLAFTNMTLEEPIEETFRVGQLGLGYDESRDLLVIIAQELGSGQAEEQMDVVRLTMSREQARALAREGSEVVNKGRKRCPQCTEPMDPAGHFCIKKNGYPTVKYDV